MSEFRLRVGETVAVRRRWWGTTWSVTYAGTIRDGTYSVAIAWDMGHNSAAYNLYLDREQREFALPVGTAHVMELSPTEIHFRFDTGGAAR